MTPLWNRDGLRCRATPALYAGRIVSGGVHLRDHEELLLPEVDAWLSRKLDPIAFASAVREYEAARPEPKPDEDARQEIADCDAKLRQHRTALEAGADPVLVTSWMKETQARRALAEARPSEPAGQRRRVTQEEITNLVTEAGESWKPSKEPTRWIKPRSTAVWASRSRTTQMKNGSQQKRNPVRSCTSERVRGGLEPGNR